MAVTAADLEIRFRSNAPSAGRELDALGSKVKGLGGLMGTAIGTAGGFLLGGAIAAMVGGVAELTRGAFQFEAGMANVNSIAQLTDAQLKGLSASVNDLATETAQAPQALAAGLYDIYSSGFQGAEALAILETAAKGATAGMTDTATASGVLVGVLNSGIDDLNGNALTAEGAMDILFKTVDRGVITFPELAANMAQTLAPANALGISLEELGASYAILTKNAIPAAQAETALANLMKVATNPTDALTAAVKDYGYESAYALVQAEGMPGLLDAMAKATGGNAEELRKLLPDAEAYNAALTLLGEDGGKTYLAMLEEMEKAGGATDRALAKQSKSAAFAMKQAKIAFQQSATVLIGALSPAIQLVARGMAFLATNALTPAIELFGRILDPIGRFAGLLREAFGSGQGVEDLFNVLFGPGAALSSAPDLIKDVARELLNIADAFGDLWAAYQAGGFEGMADVLGEELSNIAESVGTIVLDVAVTVGNWVIDTSIDLYYALKNKIAEWLGLPGATSLDGTNATAGMTGGIPIGTLAVAVAGWVISTAVDLYDALKTKIFEWVGGGGVAAMDGTNATAGMGGISIGDVAVAVADWVLTVGIPTIGNAVGDASQWVQDWLDDHPGVTATLNSWVLVLNDPSNVNAPDVGPDISDELKRRSTTAILADWYLTLTGQPTVQDDSQVEQAVNRKVDELMRDFRAYVTSWDVVLQNPNIVGATLVPTAVNEALNAIEPVRAKLEDWNLTLGLPTVANPFVNIIAWILDWMIDVGGPEGPTVTLPAWSVDLPVPGFPSLNIGQVVGWIKDALVALGTPSVDLPFNLNITPNIGGDGEEGKGGGGLSTDVTMGLGAIGGSGGKLTAQLFTSNLDLDTSLFDKAAETALGTIKTFEQSTATADFQIDTNQVATAATFAKGVGDLWDVAQFIADFRVDTSQVATAYSFANGVGESWGGKVFTASFSVDTSGITNAVGVARTAAQDIADLLPHSPAKKGPLSGPPPSFQYIADALADAMDRMGPSADRGMGALADRFNRRVGVGIDGGRWSYADGGGGGSVVNNFNVSVPINAPVYGVDDLEDAVVDTFVDKVAPAWEQAMRRRDRSLGLNP